MFEEENLVEAPNTPCAPPDTKHPSGTSSAPSNRLHEADEVLSQFLNKSPVEEGKFFTKDNWAEGYKKLHEFYSEVVGDLKLGWQISIQPCLDHLIEKNQTMQLNPFMIYIRNEEYDMVFLERYTNLSLSEIGSGRFVYLRVQVDVCTIVVLCDDTSETRPYLIKKIAEFYNYFGDSCLAVVDSIVYFLKLTNESPAEIFYSGLFLCAIVFLYFIVELAYTTTLYVYYKRKNTAEHFKILRLANKAFVNFMKTTPSEAIFVECQTFFSALRAKKIDVTECVGLLQKLGVLKWDDDATRLVARACEETVSADIKIIVDFDQLFKLLNSKVSPGSVLISKKDDFIRIVRVIRKLFEAKKMTHNFEAIIGRQKLNWDQYIYDKVRDDSLSWEGFEDLHHKYLFEPDYETYQTIIDDIYEEYEEERANNRDPAWGRGYYADRYQIHYGTFRSNLMAPPDRPDDRIGYDRFNERHVQNLEEEYRRTHKNDHYDDDSDDYNDDGPDQDHDENTDFGEIDLYAKKRIQHHGHKKHTHDCFIPNPSDDKLEEILIEDKMNRVDDLKTAQKRLDNYYKDFLKTVQSSPPKVPTSYSLPPIPPIPYVIHSDYVGKELPKAPCVDKVFPLTKKKMKRKTQNSSPTFVPTANKNNESISTADNKEEKLPPYTPPPKIIAKEDKSSQTPNPNESVPKFTHEAKVKGCYKTKLQETDHNPGVVVFGTDNKGVSAKIGCAEFVCITNPTTQNKQAFVLMNKHFANEYDTLTIVSKFPVNGVYASLDIPCSEFIRAPNHVDLMVKKVEVTTNSRFSTKLWNLDTIDRLPNLQLDGVELIIWRDGWWKTHTQRFGRFYSTASRQCYGVESAPGDCGAAVVQSGVMIGIHDGSENDGINNTFTLFSGPVLKWIKHL
jgi:hypothetical protein